MLEGRSASDAFLPPTSEVLPPSRCGGEGCGGEGCGIDGCGGGALSCCAADSVWCCSSGSAASPAGAADSTVGFGGSCRWACRCGAWRCGAWRCGAWRCGACAPPAAEGAPARAILDPAAPGRRQAGGGCGAQPDFGEGPARRAVCRGAQERRASEGEGEGGGERARACVCDARARVRGSERASARERVASRTGGRRDRGGLIDRRRGPRTCPGGTCVLIAGLSSPPPSSICGSCDRVERADVRSEVSTATHLRERRRISGDVSRPRSGPRFGNGQDGGACTPGCLVVCSRVSCGGDDKSSMKSARTHEHRGELSAAGAGQGGRRCYSADGRAGRLAERWRWRCVRRWEACMRWKSRDGTSSTQKIESRLGRAV